MGQKQSTGGGRGSFQRLSPGDVPDSAYVLVVELEHAVALPLSKDATYVSLHVEPQLDEVRRLQRQDSSVKCSRNPSWTPPEWFEFVVADARRAHLVIQVRDGRDGRVAFSDVRLRTLFDDGQTETHDLELFGYEDGLACGAHLRLTTRLVPKQEAFDVVRDLVWEYARCEGGRPTDGLDYSDESSFFGSFDDVAPDVPPGYEIVRSWSPEKTALNPDGWQFATHLKSDRWLDDSFPFATVVRRRWTRLCRRCSSFDELDDIELHARRHRQPQPPDEPPPTTADGRRSSFFLCAFGGCWQSSP